MTNNQPSVIVVGVDGTSAGQAALAFAMQEATLRRSALEVVTTWQWANPYDPAYQQDPTKTREHAERAQDAAVSAALGATSAPPVISRHVIEGEAGPTLVRLARHADFLVVGSSHKGVLRRALLGSVSQHCVRHASCPVVVVPSVQPVNEEPDGSPEEQLPATASLV